MAGASAGERRSMRIPREFARPWYLRSRCDAAEVSPKSVETRLKVNCIQLHTALLCAWHLCTARLSTNEPLLRQGPEPAQQAGRRLRPEERGRLGRRRRVRRALLRVRAHEGHAAALRPETPAGRALLRAEAAAEHGRLPRRAARLVPGPLPPAEAAAGCGRVRGGAPEEAAQGPLRVVVVVFVFWLRQRLVVVVERLVVEQQLVVVVGELG